MLFGTMSPTTAFEDLRREMDRLFEPYLGGLGRSLLPRSRVYPAINVWDDGPRLMAEAEVPGVEPGDVDVHVMGDELTIKGHRKAREGEKLTYHRQERGTGEFTRVLTLPVEIDADTVEAVLQDGVLTITLPKEESAKPRQVEVKVK
jgi:HSP20 family protein